jgi:hypothetical protein
MAASGRPAATATAASRATPCQTAVCLQREAQSHQQHLSRWLAEPVAAARLQALCGQQSPQLLRHRVARAHSEMHGRLTPWAAASAAQHPQHRHSLVGQQRPLSCLAGAAKSMHMALLQPGLESKGLVKAGPLLPLLLAGPAAQKAVLRGCCLSWQGPKGRGQPAPSNTPRPRQ